MACQRAALRQYKDGSLKARRLRLPPPRLCGSQENILLSPSLPAAHAQYRQWRLALQLKYSWNLKTLHTESNRGEYDLHRVTEETEESQREYGFHRVIEGIIGSREGL